MYTTTMTVDELINEFTADLPQILSISDAKQKKADKIIKKSQLFPVYLHAKIKTKRGNDWLLLIEAKNKKYVGDDCLMTMVSIPLLMVTDMLSCGHQYKDNQYILYLLLISFQDIP